MLWFVALFAVIGVAVLLILPFLRSRGAPDPEQQPEVEAGGPTPPVKPDHPIPGSRTDRERKGSL